MTNLQNIKFDFGQCYKIEFEQKKYAAFVNYNKTEDIVIGGHFCRENKIINIIFLELIHRKSENTFDLIKVILNGKILFLWGGNAVESYEQLI